MASEKELKGLSGWVMVFAVVLAAAAAFWSLTRVDQDAIIAAVVAILVLDAALLAGLTVVNPNQASVVTLFGVYKGTIKRPGLWWVNPLNTRRKALAEGQEL